ncbi:hypothetical protein [Staphylococcus nepalensis]|uniref:hypothetical protein n=2 Tax=Staphylococcus nepalensis TaxID=214473 RepID=UPI003EE6C0A0
MVIKKGDEKMERVMNENEIRDIFARYGVQDRTDKNVSLEEQEFYKMEIFNRNNEVVEVTVVFEPLNDSTIYGISINDKEEKNTPQIFAHFSTKEKAVEVLDKLNVYK